MMLPQPLTLRNARMRSRNEKGLSLIELMIAITLGLLILAGMVLIFANTSAARNEVERTARQIENGRYAIELLREDIQLAGFFGELNIGLVALPGSEPDPCSTVLADWTGALKVHVQGVDNFSSGYAAPHNLSCLPDVKPNTDVILIRRAKTCVAGVGGCDAVTDGKAYLQVPLCSQETATHTLDLATGASGTTATNFVHKVKSPDPLTCAPAALAPLRPYVVYFFYVGTDNTLKRAEFTGGAIGNVMPLVDGIENMQIDYGVDTTVGGDGAADVYQAGSPTTAWTAASWSDVMTVQINILARNMEDSPRHKDVRTYNLGPSGVTVGPFNDSRRRNVYTANVRIQNPSGLRDKP